jgi:hypothetical protein
MRRAFLQIGLVLAAVAIFVAFLLWLHPTLLDRLRGTESYRLAITEVKCEAPASLSRTQFLEEVQYYAALPERLDLLEAGLDEKLKGAFSRHPWVERVEKVRVSPHAAEVDLVFRRPVLGVKVGTDVRAVDARGVLLPRNAAVKGLPVLEGKVDPPHGPEGAPWGDARVEQAAREAAGK